MWVREEHIISIEASLHLHCSEKTPLKINMIELHFHHKQEKQDQITGDFHSKSKCTSCLSLTFTARKGVAPLSFILALQHRLPHQVETGIAGQLDLGPRADLHSGGEQVGHCTLQLGAVWRDRYDGVRATGTLKAG